MKFLKSLFGKAPEKQPLVWDIKPPAERPEPRPRATENPVAPPPKDKNALNPFLDDPMLDTMSLQTEDLQPEDNPYQTQSWKADPEGDTRKMRSVPIGTQTDKASKVPFNPYDTGKMRRGWKK